MKKISFIAIFLLLYSSAAYATMLPFYTFSGEGAGLSVDALGVTSTGIIQAEIPANATIQAAYLYSASVWSGDLSDVIFQGNTLTSSASSRLDVGAKQGNVASENRWDVTSIVSGGYDNLGGTYNFNVTETGYLDGEVLAVAYSVAGGEVRTAMVFDGELATGGDSFTVYLAEPHDGSSDVIMSLGISYGYQESDQYTLVDVNGNRLTTSAGGQDDGYSSNGGLITAGGIGDSIANPANPYALPSGYSYDDELYNLASFMNTGDTAINISTRNPSGDDNVFFMGLTVKGLADPIDPIDPIPEPATMLLLGTGLIGLAGLGRKKFFKKS